jgi:hypothetical protein
MATVTIRDSISSAAVGNVIASASIGTSMISFPAYPLVWTYAEVTLIGAGGSGGRSMTDGALPVSGTSGAMVMVTLLAQEAQKAYTSFRFNVGAGGAAITAGAADGNAGGDTLLQGFNGVWTTISTAKGGVGGYRVHDAASPINTYGTEVFTQVTTPVTSLNMMEIVVAPEGSRYGYALTSTVKPWHTGRYANAGSFYGFGLGGVHGLNYGGNQSDSGAGGDGYAQIKFFHEFIGSS